ncbi:MAG: hypothetical protein JSV04_00445 [Candidatus Heimdallarchaeota archaeon]|nr:MAG: hypothetical protein JSV04_00445 [Candidatus Heimdallarchaeota archaeon]
MMKRILGSILNFILLVMVFSTLFIAINFNTAYGVSGIHGSYSPHETDLNGFELLEFFDTSDFSNISHQINVSRLITGNQYGYTASYTTIHLSLLDNATQAINAFNFTVPNHERQATKFFRIYSSNDTETDSTEVLATIEKNDSTVFVVKIPQISQNQDLTINIEMDHLNAISFEEDAQLQTSTFPYLFNLSFLPLISFPITSYQLEWRVGEDYEGNDIRFFLDNDSVQPTFDEISGNFSQDDYSMVFENITELQTINRSLLNTPDFGNYNLTSLENRNFIPAHVPALTSNLTSYLSFNYRQQENTKIEFTKLKSVVTVSEWGSVTTKHEITLLNNGMQSGDDLSTVIGIKAPLGVSPEITFLVPPTAGKIGVRDKYGNLTPQVTLKSILNKKMVEIVPRIQIEPGESYDLDLSYQEQISDVVKDIGGGKVQLLIPLSMNFNWTIHQFEFNLLLPHGSSYNLTSVVGILENKISRDASNISTTRERELLGIFDKTGPRVILEDLTPLSNQYMEITFSPFPLYFIQTPLSICILFLILGLAYTLIRNLSFGLKPKRLILEEIPIDLIKEFVKAYEEKTALREQVLRLDRKRKSRKINAREYEQTQKILRNQQQRNDRTIVTASRKLAEESPRYRISMRSIEVAEANREDILQNIESLERKKSQGRIGKEAYAKLKLNYDKQLRKANNEVDKVLIDLRSLLTK